jgi:hypothetical protein
LGTALAVAVAVAVGGGGAAVGFAVGGVVTAGFGAVNVGAGTGLNVGVGAGFGGVVDVVVVLCDGATLALLATLAMRGIVDADAEGSDVGTSSANTGLGRIAALPAIGSATRV